MKKNNLFDRVRKVMNTNMKHGHVGDIPYHYTKPSEERYPYQFFWDTCFHTFILTALGETDMAQKHLRSLFQLQRKDGFVGHMIYWDRHRPQRITDIFQSTPRLYNLYRSHMSALVQPPLAAHALWRIYQSSQDRTFLREMNEKLKKFYRYLARERDFDGDGLITIISNFESGMDWKPTYDVVHGFPAGKADWRLFLKVVGVDIRNYLRDYNLKKIRKAGYFLVKDAGFNAIYAYNLRKQAEICEILDDKEADWFHSEADRVTTSICEVHYDEKDAAFYDVHGVDNEKIRIKTPTIFYPLMLDKMPEGVRKRVLRENFFDGDQFNTPFSLPSVAVDHPSFNPEHSIYIWRGPVWVVNVWFMYHVFHHCGYREQAQKLLEEVLNLIETSGFREYYNPYSGEGYGARHFSWSGLVVDMIEMERNYKRTKNETIS